MKIFAVLFAFAALPLRAMDLTALGPERPFHDPGIAAAPANVGRPIANEDGYLLLFNRVKSSVSFEPLRMMQLDMAGRPLAQWELGTAADLFPETIGVRTASGTYVVNWTDLSNQETLAFLAPNGRDIVRQLSFPRLHYFAALDCGVDRCVGATNVDGVVELYAFSFDGRQLAGPFPFSREAGSVAIVAEGGVFRLLWSDRGGVHVTAIDGALRRFETVDLAASGSAVAAAWNLRPTYFFVDGKDVKAVLPGQPPKTVAYVDAADLGTIDAAWNGTEFLVLIHAFVSTSVSGFE